MKTLENKISTKITLILLTVVLGFYSCKKNSVAPTPALSSPKMSFGVQAVSAASLAPAALAANLAGASPAVAPLPPIVWTQGIANIAEFRFEAKKAGKETEVRAEGLTNVDLFALSPLFANTTIDTGTYKEIEVKLEFVKSSTAAIPLTIKGSFTPDTGAMVPVEIDVNQNLEIKAEAKNVVVDNTTDLKTIITLHLNNLLAGITVADLNGATKTGGVIIISATSNTAIFNKIALNVQHCGDTKMEDKHDNNGGGGDHGNGDGQGHH